MKRRDFLKLISSIPIMSLSQQARSNIGGKKHNYLVMLELKGGNDSLNTFIPISDSAYYSSRPTIAISREESIGITGDLGFHPALKNLRNIYSQSDMALLNNVGYPNPNKSHFTSLDIVEKAVSGDNGWGYEVMKNYDRDLDGIVFSGSSGLFEADAPNFVKMKSIKNFVKQSRWLSINKRSRNPQVLKYNHTKALIKRSANILEHNALNSFTYTPEDKESKMAKQLSQIAKVIKSNTSMPILKLHIPGFDTHANQLSVQSDLLQDLDNSLGEFVGYLKKEGLWGGTVVYAFSEFGRRIRENGNDGTDHGEGYTGFVLGGSVSGGIYGGEVDLSGDNIRYKIDHRQIFHTLEGDWLNVRQVTKMVRGFDKIKFMNS
jgi:uncharacterized protein (DUF1501 family)